MLNASVWNVLKLVVIRRSEHARSIVGRWLQVRDLRNCHNQSQYARLV
jgi:hypothetical protein